jgi:hypothetical protein
VSYTCTIPLGMSKDELAKRMTSFSKAYDFLKIDICEL